MHGESGEQIDTHASSDASLPSDTSTTTVGPGTRGEGPPGTSAVRLTAGSVCVAALAALAACSSSELRVGPENTGALSLSVSVPMASGGSSSATSIRRQITVNRGGDQLTIEQVDLVLREIQAGRQGSECTFRSAQGGADTDDCNEFNSQTTDITLPSSGSDSTLTNIAVVEGTFDRLELRFEVVEPGQEIELANRRPDLRNASVLLTGTFTADGGTDAEFTLKLDLEDELTLDLPQPVTVGVDEQAGVVLNADVGAWFVAEDGGLIDPGAVDDPDRGEAVETEIEDNLRTSFSASPAS